MFLAYIQGWHVFVQIKMALISKSDIIYIQYIRYERF